MRIITVLVTAALWLVNSAHAQDTTLPYTQTIDVVYGEVHGTGLLMDVFTPAGKPNGLAIVDVVSGAWNSDRRKIAEHAMAQIYTIFCRRGYTVFAVRPGSKSRYTLSEMAAHVRLGIQYVKKNAGQYHIDPERIGLTGASAGGHLACLAAIQPDPAKPEAKNALQQLSSAVRAVAVFFPPTDFLDWNGKMADSNLLGSILFVGGSRGQNEEEILARAREASPARLVNGKPVPFLLIHGDADPLVPLQQSEKMVSALKAAGGSAELIIKKGGGHPWFTIYEEVQVMADWFDRELKPQTPAPGSASGPHAGEHSAPAK